MYIAAKEMMYDIPQPIKTVASKQQEKVYLLNLEKELIAFIKDPILSKNDALLYTIQASVLKNSYYRLISHQICQYYHLQHWNNASNDIIVTFCADGFDYEKLIRAVDLEDKSFIKISDYLKQNQGDGAASREGDRNNAKIIKPKVIIRKGALLKGHTDVSSEATLISDILVNDHNSSPETLNTSQPASADDLNPPSDVIESERASKEALYMKIREKIFQDQKDEEDDEEEDDDKKDDEEDDDLEDQNQEGQHLEEGSVNDDRSASTDNTGMYNIHNPELPQYPYANPHLTPPMPMGMPSNYNGNLNLPPFVNPNNFYNSPNQSMYSPQMNPYHQYPNYFPSPPMMVHQNGFYPPAFNGNSHFTPYDKETERKLLNNPYIIIPDSNRDKKTRKPFKPRYNNGNSNPSMQQNGSTKH